MNVTTNHQAPHGAATNRSTLMRRTLLVTAVTAIVVAALGLLGCWMSRGLGRD